MTRAICIGECMVELRAVGDGLYHRSFAGDAYNTAVYLKRSSPALGVDFCTAVGTDPLSNEMRHSWKDEEIGEALAFEVSDGGPGLYLIETDAKGDRRFHYWRKASAATHWWRELSRRGFQSRLVGVDLLYFSGISLAILSAEERQVFLHALRIVDKGNCRIAFDPNLRPTLWPSLDVARKAVEDAIALSDIVLPSSQDMDSLYGHASPQDHASRLTALGAREFALTTDTSGAWLFAEALHHLPQTATVKAIDTSGAGDAFNGAYLSARLAGDDQLSAAKAGLRLASDVVTQLGAIVPKNASKLGKSANG